MDAGPPGGAGACVSFVPGLKLQVAAWLTVLGGLESQGLLVVSLLLEGGAALLGGAVVVPLAPGVC